MARALGSLSSGLTNPATAGGSENELFEIAKGMLATPDTIMGNFVLAEQAAERLKDGFAEYFQRHDALLCPVLPIAAHPHGVSEFVINGQIVPTKHILSATVPFKVTGLPWLSIRFGTSWEGLPIGVQLVSTWLAESTVLHLDSLLEAISPVRDLAR
jgi:aspartyl-tRNA(Asn)/glutamyl-tRNA(Gln) amidotransferase subunit A